MYSYLLIPRLKYCVLHSRVDLLLHSSASPVLTRTISFSGVIEIDQIITVLFKTNMFVGGLVGFVLDNTVPGTPEERGIRKWREILRDSDDKHVGIASIHTYDLPFGLNKLSNHKFAKYVPFLPYYPENFGGPEKATNGRHITSL